MYTTILASYIESIIEQFLKACTVWQVLLETSKPR